MTTQQKYSPGPATGAQVRKNGDSETWTLVLDRDLAHPAPTSSSTSYWFASKIHTSTIESPRTV